jgi:hypothetical protein
LTYFQLFNAASSNNNRVSEQWTILCWAGNVERVCKHEENIRRSWECIFGEDSRNCDDNFKVKLHEISLKFCSVFDTFLETSTKFNRIAVHINVLSCCKFHENRRNINLPTYTGVSGFPSVLFRVTIPCGRN